MRQFRERLQLQPAELARILSVNPYLLQEVCACGTAAALTPALNPGTPAGVLRCSGGASPAALRSWGPSRRAAASPPSRAARRRRAPGCRSRRNGALPAGRRICPSHPRVPRFASTFLLLLLLPAGPLTPHLPAARLPGKPGVPRGQAARAGAARAHPPVLLAEQNPGARSAPAAARRRCRCSHGVRSAAPPPTAATRTPVGRACPPHSCAAACFPLPPQQRVAWLRRAGLSEANVVTSIWKYWGIRECRASRVWRFCVCARMCACDAFVRVRVCVCVCGDKCSGRLVGGRLGEAASCLWGACARVGRHVGGLQASARASVPTGTARAAPACPPPAAPQWASAMTAPPGGWTGCGSRAWATTCLPTSSPASPWCSATGARWCAVFWRAAGLGGGRCLACRCLARGWWVAFWQGGWPDSGLGGAGVAWLPGSGYQRVAVGCRVGGLCSRLPLKRPAAGPPPA